MPKGRYNTIMISHDITAAIEYASHVLHVDRQTFFGTKEEYLSSDAGKRFLIQKEMEENRSWRN